MSQGELQLIDASGNIRSGAAADQRIGLSGDGVDQSDHRTDLVCC
jgi:hypothetical protein